MPSAPYLDHVLDSQPSDLTNTQPLCLPIHLTMAITRSKATKVAAKTSTITSHTPASKAPATSSNSFPEKTPDGHYIIVHGRKWRATDPLIPTEALSELKHYLGRGRSGVRPKKTGADEASDAIKLARQRTGLAKLGLGERGKPEWWNNTEAGRKKRWEDALRELKALDEPA